MYKFLILLLLTCSFTFQQNPSKNDFRIIYKVDKDGEWVEQELKKNPIYQSGETDVQRFLAKQIRYPALAQRHNVSGVVLISAEVTEDGKLVNENIVKDLGSGLGEESLRVVKLIPDNWTPGYLDGKPVRVQVIIPVLYRIM